jgi:hypothetical protein
MAEKHPKRPRDFSQAAKLVVDIASGQVADRDLTPEEQGKDPAAVSLGDAQKLLLHFMKPRRDAVVPFWME